MNIVEKQIKAFNNKDLTTFLSFYNDDIVVSMLQSNQILADGKPALEKVMSGSFTQSSSSHTEIISSIVQGNLIIAHEQIRGHEEGKLIKSVSIYEIEDGRISKLWFGGRTAEDL